MIGICRSTVMRQVFRSFQTSPSFYAAAAGNPEVQKEIAEIVKKNKIVVFMKGDREAPKCGFSNAVIQILRMHGVDKYHTVDVLENEGIRTGVKDFSKWPTLPQVFFNGEFIGGCDIFVQMHRSGELMDAFKKAGIESKIPDPPAQKKDDGDDAADEKEKKQ